MKEDSSHPETLVEAVRYFANPETSHNFMVQLRWANGICCPRCGSKEFTAIPKRRTWECKAKHEKRQFSVKVGTIFEDSPLSLDKWLCTIWLLANAKNGVSSYEIHRSIGVTQKTGWFMLQRIRLAMQTGSFEKFKGEVESDETYIGGKAIHMHAKRRRSLPNRGLGGQGKTAVNGILQRGAEGTSQVKLTVVPDTRKETIKPLLDNTIEAGARLFTDTTMTYLKMDSNHVHQMVDHAIEYVAGRVHTNGIENFWSLLKRAVKGTYVSVDPVHLFRYLDEQAFRFNNRKTNDASRFLLAAASIIGKRLKYQDLIGNNAAPA